MKDEGPTVMGRLSRLPPQTRLAAALVVAVATLVSLVVVVTSNAKGAPMRAQDSTAPDPSGGSNGGASGTATDATARSGNNVRIVFKVVPPNRATVTWGKKKLGFIKPRAPLIVERPRDSGPLDVVVRAEGCVPVHTRAYTFTDTTVAVKVTTVDKKNTIFGYKEAPPPDADGGAPAGQSGPDGGLQIQP
jgi:hypothetical protein